MTLEAEAKMMTRKKMLGSTRKVALVTLLLATTGCAQNLRTESGGSGVESFPTTVRLTDNANAVYGDLTYYFEDDVVVSEIDAEPGDAWAHLLTAYEALGLDPDIQDPSTLTIGVQEAIVRRSLGDRRISTYMSCGRDMTGNIADRATIRIWMTTRLQPTAEGRTQVRTELTANATDNDGTSRAVRPCSSNHRLEAEVAQRVADGVATTTGAGG